MMRKLFFSTVQSVVLFFCSICCLAQNFGGNPPDIKWKNINTDTARIIFPQGLEKTAARVASVVHELRGKDSFSLGSKIRKVDIILRPDFVYSNGYVSLGPFRSEYYLMPPLNAFELGAQDWALTLAVHEGRHVQQYNNFNIGWAKVISSVFGDNGQDLLNAAAVPDWFFEGDAVYQETRFSGQGRGRLPFFLQQFNALTLSGKHYSYMKWRNGSYKNFVPNHYPLGYILVAFGYEQYGSTFWKNVTQKAAAFGHITYPWQNAIKKLTGKKYADFISSAMYWYHRQMINDSITDTARQWLHNSERNNVVNEQFPRIFGPNVFYVNSSYREIPAFKVQQPKGVRRIATSAITTDNFFSTNGRHIIYAAYRPDPRWANRQYSELRILDVSTGKEKVLTKKSRFFQPDISDNGENIIAVEQTPLQQSRIVRIDRHGRIQTKTEAPLGVTFSFPRFLPDSSILTIVRDTQGQMGIWKYGSDSDTPTILMPFQNRILGYPIIHGDTLLYTMSAKGQDAVYAYLLKEKRNFLLGHYATGLYQGDLRQGKLLSAAFTADGYRLNQAPALWQPEETVGDTLAYPLGAKGMQLRSVYDFSKRKFAVSDYRQNKYLLRLHSLQPDFDDPDYTLTLYGENSLNTFQTNISYSYNRNEHAHYGGISAVYGRTFIEPLFSIGKTWHRSALTDSGIVHWNEMNIVAGGQLPLNFTAGKWYRYLNLYSAYRYHQVLYQGTAADLFQNTHFSFIESQASYSMYSQQAKQQIYSPWGWSMSIQSRNGISADAHQWLVRANVYLPGILATHSVVLSAAYAERDTFNHYTFANNFPFSRGYAYVNAPAMWKISGNYHFPVFYPDWGMAQLVYFLRLRANLFYDYSTAHSRRTGTNYHFRTVGTEIYADTKWWNQHTLTFGLRYSRMMDGKPANRWEIIMPVSIFD